MDRDRDDDRDDDRRLIPRGRGRGSSALGRDGPSADRFDPAEWDTPIDPQPPSPAARARSEADAAQAFGMFSGIDTGIQRILANFGLFRDFLADARASVAEAAAFAAKQAEAAEARDKIITARLLDPDMLARHAEAGARQGAREALDGSTREWTRQLATDAAARDLISKQMVADQEDRRHHEMRRRRQDGWRNGAVLAIALLIPAAYGVGSYQGRGTGNAEGYARAQDEKAAASWANTANGKLARQIDQASEQTIPAIANCPKDAGWRREKRDGVYWCFGANHDAQPYNGWAMP